MTEYLAIWTGNGPDDVVVGSGSDLPALVRDVQERGYTSGYVTNQDGGRATFSDLFARYGIGETDEDEDDTRDLSHWHVGLSDEDENRFYPLGFWDMVTSAADELRVVSEYLFEGFRIQSDNGEFERGYADYLRSDETDIQARNLENIAAQFHAADEDRAPLWKGKPESFFRDRVWSILGEVTEVYVSDCHERACVLDWERDEDETWTVDEHEEANR